jgi:hypothetical protein
MTGKLTVRRAVASTVKTDELVAKYCEYLGIKDGKIGTKIDLTEDVIKAIEKVTIECGVDVKTLIAAITNKASANITFVRDGKEVKIDDLTTDIYVALHDKALVSAIDTVTAMLTDIHDTLSAEEIVAKIADISAFYKVDVDDLTNSILARTDIQVVHSKAELTKVLEGLPNENIVAGFMSSGDFNGLTKEDLVMLF